MDCVLCLRSIVGQPDKQQQLREDFKPWLLYDSEISAASNFTKIDASNIYTCKYDEHKTQEEEATLTMKLTSVIWNT